MPREVTIPYTPRPLQRDLHGERRRYRWGVVVCHRRWGKTVWCVNELLRAAILSPRKGERVPLFAYIAPFRAQAKAVAWDYVRYYAAVIPGVEIRESELRVDLPNGARLQLFGSDNADAMRGLGVEGCVLDEFAVIAPRVWTEVVRPTLADTLGWALVTGTPMGMNHFHDLWQLAQGDPDWLTRLYKASETGIIPGEELRQMQRSMSPEHYAQEMECSWTAGVPGAYFAGLLQTAEGEGRISNVPHDPSLEVHTAWDLGVGDSTAIWFAQAVGRELRLIDYYESAGEGLPHYARILSAKPYKYGRHIAPHDAQVRELGTGASRVEVAKGLGIEFEVQPAQRLEDGIEAARVLIPMAWFDRERCKDGLAALRAYRRGRVERTGEWKSQPVHDWASHGSDAFRYLALGMNQLRPRAKRQPLKIDTRGIH